MFRGGPNYQSNNNSSSGQQQQSLTGGMRWGQQQGGQQQQFGGQQGGYGGGQQQQGYGGGSGSGSAPCAPQPISSLSPFITRWTIKARVLDKSQKRTWNKPTSQGQLFTFTLVDDHNEAIRATIFQEGVDKFFDMIENDKVFTFSKGVVKNANKKFSNLPGDYEITFDQNSEIYPVGDDSSIVRQKLFIVPIRDLDKKEPKSTVDVCGVLLELGDVTSIKTKAGEELRKRTLTIGDQSESQIEVTLWQDVAENFTAPMFSVLVIKGARIGDFQGISLSLSQQGSIQIEPRDIVQAASLKQWYFQGGNRVTFAAMANKTVGGGGGGGFGSSDERSNFAAIRNQGLGTGEKPDWLTVRAVLTFIKQENMWYVACAQCNRKVTAVSDGSEEKYRCANCDKETQANYRYILTLTAIDHTGSQWLTAFHDVGKTLFGMEAKEINDNMMTNPNFIATLCKEKVFTPFVLRLRVKEEQVNDEKRLKAVVQKMDQIDFAKESHALLQEIKRYQQLG